MMKLYLSSYRIPNPKKFALFVGKKLNDIKFGLVLNAKDYKIPEERKEKRDELLEYFSGLGLKVEEIDLREYYDGRNIENKFKNYDVVWLNIRDVGS